ncbi:MAG: sigma-70 family RNA polymerase sigma factor [Deltaproteobacteria bacterium]|nr:sigma-70 family RNA polymerase sigma factor [Deltaproteobacteria bacterium]
MAREKSTTIAALTAPVATPLDLSALYSAYARYVGAIAMRILGNAADTEEVVQDVFAEAMRAASGINDAAAIRGWLATVTVRMSRKRLKRQRLFAAFGLCEVAAYENTPSGEISADDRILLKRMSVVIAHMPVDARIAWVLRHVDGEQLDRIAEMMGCSLATVKRRICEAQHMIDSHFEDAP